MHLSFEAIRFTAIITIIKFSTLITEVIGVIRIVEVMREGYKNSCVQGLHKLARILITMLIKNIISPPESRGQQYAQVPRGQQYAQVPQVAENMSMRWSHEKHKSGVGE